MARTTRITIVALKPEAHRRLKADGYVTDRLDIFNFAIMKGERSKNFKIKGFKEGVDYKIILKMKGKGESCRLK